MLMNSKRLACWLAVLAFHAPLAARAADLPMLHAKGPLWATSDGKPATLKGVNLGNWLINEFWMMGQGSNGISDQCTLEAVFDKRFGYPERERLMKLFRDNWITARDWDQIAAYGMNVVRLPFIHTVLEDEKNPGHLRADAWDYLDGAIDQAERRGIYVILDLHGAAGSQGTEHHSGCAGKNQYFSTPAYQQRTTWLWQQIAARYKDRGAVAGYSVLNEPWGTSGENMARVVKELYRAIRAVDPNHVIILPGHDKDGIDVYGKPSGQGMSNVAFEAHPYPGMFGWGKPGLEVHRNWLRCGPSGKEGVCEWDARMRRLDAPLLIGEFQPWAQLGPALSARVTRASYDTYAKYGWAATAWSYKLVSVKGGQGKGTWGLVTNSTASPLPQLDFNQAPLTAIESLFTGFGKVEYAAHPGMMEAMRAKTAPAFP
jgi:endoglucanase